MMDISGTRSEQNLKTAIVGEHNVFIKFLHYRSVADVSGPHEVAEFYRATALLRGGHPKIDQFFKDTLLSMVEGQPGQGPSAVPYDRAIYTPGALSMWYPMPNIPGTMADVNKYNQYAVVARSEGFGELADWFEKLALAESSTIPGEAPHPASPLSHPGISFEPL